MEWRETMRAIDGLTPELFQYLQPGDIPTKKAGSVLVIWRNNAGYMLKEDGSFEYNEFFRLTRPEIKFYSDRWKSMSEKIETGIKEEDDKKNKAFESVMNALIESRKIFIRNKGLIAKNKAGEMIALHALEDLHRFAKDEGIVLGANASADNMLRRIYCEGCSGTNRLPVFEGPIALSGRDRHDSSHRVYVGDVLKLKKDASVWEKYRKRLIGGTWANLRTAILSFYYGISSGDTKSFFVLYDDGDRGKTVLLNALALAFCVPRGSFEIQDILSSTSMTSILGERALLVEVRGDDNHATEGLDECLMLQANELPFNAKLLNSLKAWTGNGTFRINPKGKRAHAGMFHGIAFLATNRKFSKALFTTKAAASRMCPILLDVLTQEDLENTTSSFSMTLAENMGYAVEMCVSEMREMGHDLDRMKRADIVSALKNTRRNLQDKEMELTFVGSGAASEDNIDLSDVFQAKPVAEITDKEFEAWTGSLAYSPKKRALRLEDWPVAISEDAIRRAVKAALKEEKAYDEYKERLTREIVKSAKEYAGHFVAELEKRLGLSYRYRGELFMGLVPLIAVTNANSRFVSSASEETMEYLEVDSLIRGKVREILFAEEEIIL